MFKRDSITLDATKQADGIATTGGRISLFANNLLDRLIEPPPDNFSASLSAGSENVSCVPPAKRLITALIILCAIPRLLMMWRIDAVCNDAYYYISIADLLERGQFEGAFEYLNLNVYPVVLLLFHKLGIDWVTGGQLWGVFISSLVVAPLFGWVRHAFNDKVAIVACFLYAIQPQLIEISAEPIREPMFWFFFNLCLYFNWRSVTSMRWWMFVASGITFGLASYTRSEGWLLLLPILLWPILCRVESWFVRVRLMAGTCLSLAMIPALLVVVNVTLLRDHDRWEWGRYGNFSASWNWLTTEADSADGPTPTRGPGINFAHVGGTTPPLASTSFARAIPAQQTTQMLASFEPATEWPISIYLDDLLNSLELPACVLLLTGLFGWRHLLRKREYIVFVLMAACVFFGVWAKLHFSGGINGRYFFTGWFVLLPFAALGLLALAHRVSQLQLRGFLAERGRTVVGTLVVVMTLVSCGDAITSSHKSRQRQASLGRWLNAEYGPFETVLVDNAATRIGYYAKGTIPEVCQNQLQFSELLNQQRPTLVIVADDFLNAAGDSSDSDSAHLKNAYRVPSSALPPHNDGFAIYIRNPSPGRKTQTAANTQRSRR